MAEEFERTRNKDIIWEGHFAGIELGYCHMEKLTSLHLPPPAGFKVI